MAGTVRTLFMLVGDRFFLIYWVILLYLNGPPKYPGWIQRMPPSPPKCAFRHNNVSNLLLFFDRLGDDVGDRFNKYLVLTSTSATAFLLGSTAWGGSLLIFV